MPQKTPNEEMLPRGLLHCWRGFAAEAEGDGSAVSPHFPIPTPGISSALLTPSVLLPQPWPRPCPGLSCTEMCGLGEVYGIFNTLTPNPLGKTWWPEHPLLKHPCPVLQQRASMLASPCPDPPEGQGTPSWLSRPLPALLRDTGEAAGIAATFRNRSLEQVQIPQQTADAAC